MFFLAALGLSSGARGRTAGRRTPHGVLLLVALGGVLGSMFNTLAAPLLFTRIVEYPAVLVLVCLLRGVRTDAGTRRGSWRIAAPIIVGIAMVRLVMASRGDRLRSSTAFALLGVPAFLCLSLSRTRLPFAAAIAGDAGRRRCFSPIHWAGAGGESGHSSARTRVRLNSAGEYRTLAHGTTMHGLQSVSRARRREPLTAITIRAGPLGDVFGLHCWSLAESRSR